MTSTPALEWDMDEVVGFTDATCDFQGADTEAGPSDDHGLFPAGQATVQLANPTGQWSRYNADGTQATYGPGHELAIWAHYNATGNDHWLFRGTITGWNDLGDHVEVEAHDSFADLAQGIGTYTPGANGDTPPARLAAILAAASRSALPVRLGAGDVVLTAQPTTRAPLEEMQVVSASDGGELFVDADGTLVSLRRTWRTGRTDQTTIPVVSDNVCTADTVIWEAVLSTNDTNVADTVILENVAKLRAQSPAGPIGRFVVTETGQQWTTQLEGDTLASFVWTAQQLARVNVETFDLFLNDPLQPNLYKAVEWRLFDVLRFLHDYLAADGTTARLDINTLIQGISHSILPDGNWIMTVSTTKALTVNLFNIWNPPADPYAWDTPGAVWGYA